MAAEYHDMKSRPPTCSRKQWISSVRLALSFYSLSLASFHLDLYAHPGMDAALKEMFTFRQVRDLNLAALKDSGPGHGEVCKAAGALGNHFLAGCIESRYKSTTETRHLSEGVRLTALIDYGNGGSFPDVDDVRFEVPVRVRSSGGCFGE